MFMTCARKCREKIPNWANYHKERSTLLDLLYIEAIEQTALLKTGFPHLDACSQRQMKIEMSQQSRKGKSMHTTRDKRYIFILER